MKTPSLDLGTGMASDDPTEEEELESGDIHDLPPLQIVMLIVGTRGDVQPFVAIGKRLQVFYLLSFVVVVIIIVLIITPPVSICSSYINCERELKKWVNYK